MDKPESYSLQNYYKLLNVESNADIKDIMKAYELITQKLNLDSAILGGVTGHLEYQLDLYTKAFTTLTSPDDRKEYDFQLEQQEKNIIQDLSRNMKKAETEQLIRDKKVLNDKAKELFLKAKNLLQQGKYDESIFTFKELIDIDHSNARYHSNFGLALKEKGWNGYAQAEFKIALHYDRNDPLALKHYRKSIKSEPAKIKVSSSGKEPEKQGLISRFENIFNRVVKRRLPNL